MSLRHALDSSRPLPRIPPTTGAILYAVFGSKDDIIYKIMSDPSRKLFHEAGFADMSDDATAGDNVVNALKATGV